MDWNSRPKSKNYSSLTQGFVFLKPYKWQVFFGAFFLISTAFVTLLLGRGLSLLVDHGFTANTQQELIYYISIIIGIGLFVSIGTYFRHYIVSWIGERVSSDIRYGVFHNVLNLPPSFFEENLSSEIQTRITTDTTILQSVVGSSVSFALRNLLLFVGGVIWLFFTSPKLTGIVLISVPLILIPIFYFGKKVRVLSRNSQDKLASVGSYVSEALHNVKLVQAFNHEAEGRKKFRSVVEEQFDVSIEKIKIRSLLIALVILLVLGGIAFMLYIGGRDVMNGEMTPGGLASFSFYAIVVGSSIAAVSEIFGDLQRAAGATERLLELYHTTSSLPSPKNPESLPANSKNLSISLNDVGFVYSSRPDTPALKNLNITFEAGKTTALVGPSGAGKSTIFDLLLRFRDPTSGSLTFGGIDLRNLDVEEYRRKIAFVPQESALFSTTLRENLLFANHKATESDLIEALELAELSTVLKELPQGLDTFLGDSGVRLSGGQRQRLSIARALLKNPEILLLDEATSALDSESESKIQEALRRLSKGRTTIIIAHRLSTVIHAEKIVVLENGEKQAEGTHKELLETSPLYGRLARLQFLGELHESKA